MGDQEARVVGLAGDVEAHQVRLFVRETVGLIIRKRGQRPKFADRAQPRVEQIALLDGSDHRGIGALEFHLLTEFDDVAGRNAAGGAVEKVAIDDGAKLCSRQGVVPPHQIPDLKAAVFADGL